MIQEEKTRAEGKIGSTEEIAASMNARKAIEQIEKDIAALKRRVAEIKLNKFFGKDVVVIEYQLTLQKIAELEITVENIQSGKTALREKDGHIFLPQRKTRLPF